MLNVNNVDYIKELVSIIIPTFNRSVFLQEAIQSCLSQTYRPIECIVVDDGSSDNTREIVKEWVKNTTDSFTLRYIYQENAGSQIARNTGTKASTGEFIQYLDSDDLLYPDKIKSQVSFLQVNQDCDGVWGGWAKGAVDKNELIQSLASEDLLTQFLTEHCVVNFSFLMRRTLIEKIGPWDENIKRNQEIDFQVRGLLAGANYKYHPQICGLWRIHDGERIASTTGAKELFKFYQKWERILNNNGVFNNQLKLNISNNYFWIAQQVVEPDGNKIRTAILTRSFKLNPEIPFANTGKMKLLRKFLPLNICIRLWWIWAKKNNLGFE